MAYTELQEDTKIKASVLNANFQAMKDYAQELISASDTTLDAKIEATKTSLTNSYNSLNAAAVKTSGNQSIAGNKTFTGTTKVPNSAAVGTACSTADISKGTNGFVKFGNGIIIQWGQFSSTNRTTTKVTLPTKFTKATYSVVYSQYGTAVLDTDWINSILTVSKHESYFEYRSNLEEKPKYQWLAIGY